MYTYFKLIKDNEKKALDNNMEIGAIKWMFLYSDFKIKILELGNRDRKEYKKTKSEYVTNLLNRSKDWYKNSMSKIH